MVLENRKSGTRVVVESENEGKTEGLESSGIRKRKTFTVVEGETITVQKPEDDNL